MTEVQILVASKNLSVHQRLAKPEELFELKAISKDAVPPDAITDFEVLKGKTLKTGRNKGEFVTVANLYDKGQLEIPEGYQAVGVRVNVETTASGLASLPGRGSISFSHPGGRCRCDQGFYAPGKRAGVGGRYWGNGGRGNRGALRRS